MIGHLFAAVRLFWLCGGVLLALWVGFFGARACSFCLHTFSRKDRDTSDISPHCRRALLNMDLVLGNKSFMPWVPFLLVALFVIGLIQGHRDAQGG